MRLISTGTSRRLDGALDIPVSKYHAHRALVLASLAPGRSTITGISTTRQVEWTVAVLRALGTRIEVTDTGYVVTGGRYHGEDHREQGSNGLDGLLNVGSSGTTLYFMIGLASLSDRPTTLTGMKYFRRRPVKALLDALGEMGVEHTSAHDCPPITVQPQRPRGGDVHIAGTLSQWISGLLLVAPFARERTVIHVEGPLNERPYVELTVRMMEHWGLRVDVADDWRTLTVEPDQTAAPADYAIPPDVGAAAFGIAAAALHPSDVLFRGLAATRAADVDHPEAEFLDIAAGMGVPMTIDPESGWVRIRHDGLRLRPFDIDATPIPDLLPILSVMASFATGTSHLRNVAHIRLKESDRVAAMLQLNKMGGSAWQEPTELHVRGIGDRPFHGAELSSFNDHRVLMSLAIAGTRASGVTSLTYPRAYRISYPTFLEQMNGIGLDIDVDAPAPSGEEAAAMPSVEAPVDTSFAEPLVLPLAVRHRAALLPDEPAVMEVGGEETVVTSWAELQAEADRVSQLLLELGVERGEAVAVQLPNWGEFEAIALGIMQIGAVVTPIMPVFGPRETAMTLARSHARVLFLPTAFRGRQAAAELADVVEEAAQQRRRLAVEHVVVLDAAMRTGDRALDVSPIPDRLVALPEASAWTWRYYRSALAAMTPDLSLINSRMPGPDDVCQLLFTSGTTGEPKGVQHSYRTLGIATAMHVRRSGLTSEDRVFIPSPLAHQTGFLYGMLLAWRLGVAAVIQPVWDAELALEEAFGKARATFVQAATPFLTDLVALVERGRRAPDSLRIFVPTGAAVPRALAQRATTVLDCVVLGAFGTTETCLGALASPSDPPEQAWGSDGRALDGIELRIVDDAGNPLPAGSEGNFELRSPTMFGGYLERPDLTADVFTEDGWYRTGDLARLDDHGFLHITGRVKDVINRGGEKVPVVEIENLLYQHPLIADVAIVAMPDPRLGERACAFVVAARPEQPLGFREMQDYLAQSGVSKYYWPERLEYVEALPRNVVGKIQKNVLRERAARLVAS